VTDTNMSAVDLRSLFDFSCLTRRVDHEPLVKKRIIGPRLRQFANGISYEVNLYFCPQNLYCRILPCVELPNRM